MKFKRIFLTLVLVFVSAIALTSCAFKAFEKEIHVVFMAEGDYFGSGIVTQFDSIYTPELPKSYIPDGYKFLGWTGYDLDEINPKDPQLKDKYVKDGKMVHYGDIIDQVHNSTVVLRALIVDKAELPADNHYAVIAWYNNAKSQLTEAKMNEMVMKVKAYLLTKGYTEQELSSIIVRPYDGQVGTSTGNILDDDDVDIMLGWGSLDNVTTTGVLKPEMIFETVHPYVINGANRSIHRLTNKATAIEVMEWLKSEEAVEFFK